MRVLAGNAIRRAERKKQFTPQESDAAGTKKRSGRQFSTAEGKTCSTRSGKDANVPRRGQCDPDRTTGRPREVDLARTPRESQAAAPVAMPVCKSRPAYFRKKDRSGFYRNEIPVRHEERGVGARVHRRDWTKVLLSRPMSPARPSCRP